MRKILTLFLILLLIPSNVLADGVIWRPEPFGTLEQNEQIAAINYQDGLEKLIIAVNFNMGAEQKAVWVFPVPSKPEKVVIDVVKDFPRFSGTDPSRGVAEGLAFIIGATTLSQIYPIIFAIPFYFFISGVYTGRVVEERIAPGVTVHETLEKEGITTELITAETGDALYNYLLGRGLSIQRDSIAIFDDYIGKEYSFVVSWVSSLPGLEREYRGYYPYGRQPGIFITFPTDKIYYPLLPTSIYGSKSIPIRIYVLSYVRPKTYDEIKGYVKTSYFTQSWLDTYGLTNFYGNIDRRNVRYTRIEMNVPSKYFVDDLWFERGAPFRVSYASFLNSLISNPILAGFVFLVLISLLSGGFAGFVIYRDIKKFALLGLANIFTIIGLAIAVMFTKTKIKDEKLRKEIEKAGLMVIDKRKFSFIGLFSISYLVISFLVYLALVLPL